MPRFLAKMFLVGMMIFTSGAVSGQAYPERPIRLVTGGTGGSNDIVARLVAQGLAQSWTQGAIVDNRPSGVIPGEIVAKAKPDGYTLLVTGSSFWISVLLQDTTPYDPVKDFSPITLPVSTPNIVAVHPSLPVQSVNALIALAKARPGDLNYGTTGIGSSAHLGGELFKALARVNIVRVNYRSVGAAMNDLIAGQVQMTFGTAGSVTPHVKSGRLRALAVTSTQPSALFPGLPTVAASGLPEYELIQIFGIFGPANTPKPIVNRLNEEIVRVLNRTDVKEKIFNGGIGEVVGSSPEQLAAKVTSEMAKWGKLIEDAGIRVK